MLTASEIRYKFLNYFTEKQHTIVKSAPIVIKNDPTLMFTNAGMNQFKDLFLGNAPIKNTRVADTQKCLRVSGKHNDLDEVGHDTYHHTMFEMLGNWSFGDYFKEDAINWAWELLTKEFKISKDQLYASVYEGSQEDGVEKDQEAYNLWLKHLPKEQIIFGNKKDNFWEMGDTGPCGPCSEIHVDIRPKAEREKIDGATLVNQDHPQVIEVWNLVFMEFNRKANGSLEHLPNKHVDTGMGFERLCMVVQGKQSNYDTDVFTPLLNKIADLTGIPYGKNEAQNIAMRVIADHIRAVAFAIADGQLPSNNGAGYVIRRILRRAIRYGYAQLNTKTPFIYKLVEVLDQEMGEQFPELKNNLTLISKVVEEEEHSFLRTIEQGLGRLDQILAESNTKSIDGAKAFELYDTFGFPLDLTQLILREKGYTLNETEFEAEMLKQKERSRAATNLSAGDWHTVLEDETEEFVGYDQTVAEIRITKYREVVINKKKQFQLIFNLTPFYPEGGGQIGDQGFIVSDAEKIFIKDTKKENGKILHYVDQLPEYLKFPFKAHVDEAKRSASAKNHSATHLLHHVLRSVLGTHVEQKGSLVNNNHLRFDFSHFQKVSTEELVSIEERVNELIRTNNSLEEHRSIPIKKAEKMGAMALFGEKYGDTVRAIKFGDSIELCGGTHVTATGNIGLFKIVHETSVASGIRRIEAITAQKAHAFVNQKIDTLHAIGDLVKNAKNPIASVEALKDENAQLKKQLEDLLQEKASGLKSSLLQSAKTINQMLLINAQVSLDPKALKTLAFELKSEKNNVVLVLGNVYNNKPMLTVALSKELADQKVLHAGNMVKELAKDINGGGGGQADYATAGGKKPEGMDLALSKAEILIKNAQ